MKQRGRGSAAERLLDEAIALTFPASDPVSVVDAFRASRRRDERASGSLSRQAGMSGLKRKTSCASTEK
jgi:hypothetical protein